MSDRVHAAGDGVAVGDVHVERRGGFPREVGEAAMARAEQIIRECFLGRSPGEAASRLLTHFQRLTSDLERDALVAVLATRAAVADFLRPRGDG